MTAAFRTSRLVSPKWTTSSVMAAVFSALAKRPSTTTAACRMRRQVLPRCMATMETSMGSPCFASTCKLDKTALRTSMLWSPMRATSARMMASSPLGARHPRAITADLRTLDTASFSVVATAAATTESRRGARITRDASDASRTAAWQSWSCVVKVATTFESPASANKLSAEAAAARGPKNVCRKHLMAAATAVGSPRLAMCASAWTANLGLRAPSPSISATRPSTRNENVDAPKAVEVARRQASS
mmetsp:Transcript_52432/g.170230  ORF Transcript_52432/g.170230 Transcript_52432/m.170230 type:complete len:246 (-) Transcript_52432:153-890(-)